MDDEEILARGGDEHDIQEYAKSNGADLSREDFESPMPNKEPTKEWRGLAQEILDTVGSTKAARSKAWKENALQYIEIRIEEALKAREAELIERIDGMTFVQPAQAGQFSMHTDGYNQALEEVIALIKG